MHGLGRTPFDELQPVQPIQTSLEQCPNVSIQEQVIQTLQHYECEFVSALSEEAGTNYSADAYGIFNIIYLRQNQNRFWTPMYKSIEIESEWTDPLGSSHEPSLSMSIADKDNDSRLDYLSIDNSLILDGNVYHPLIASILESSRYPDYVAKCVNAERLENSITYGGIFIVSVLMLFVIAI